MTLAPDIQMTCVVAAKGGIGQSAISLDWARAIGRQGKRCLLLELSGGDLAWQVGATPAHFVENVADGSTGINDAVVRIEEHVSLLASGNGWGIHGPDAIGDVKSLFERLREGKWDHVVIDLGTVSRVVAEFVLTTADRRAILLQDDIACVARTYALLRRFGAGVLADHTSLVFNRIDNSTDAESLHERFSQLTSQFLNRTWPVLGTVPEGGSDQRVQAIAMWDSADVPKPEKKNASIAGAISNRPSWADN
ncbi:MAG: hypothetical protein GF341_03440 [candidate division Zixibacteria bacterium]|nr:hypothetical protein [candidate division Zixibacteria bacterium]